MGTMGTRAAAFTVKVRGLHDYHLRLLHGIMPLPSGLDGAGVLKYFSQTLLTVLRDVKAKESPLEMVKSPENDAKRMALYPNLDYRGLYNAIVQLVDIVHLIPYGIHEFGQALLQCLGCLLPFLENDMIDTLPYLTASTIAVLPSSLHQDIVNQLCYYVFPFTLTRRIGEDQETYASHSVAAILMLVFQYAENSAQHSQLMECLMSMKCDLVRDVLCVIAHGSTPARASAAKLLFHYWPSFNTALVDRKSLPNKFVTDWPPFTCQRDQCPNAGNAEAAKVCYDHDISIMFANERPPPLYLCIECANDIHSKHEDKMFFDILHPMQQVAVMCESKNCRASDKTAVSVCFSADCINYNGNHPIRFCRQCHDNRHNNRRGGDHIVHCSLKQAWDMDEEMQSYLVESIVNLFREAQWHGLEVRSGGLSSEYTSTGISSIASSSEPPLLIVEDQLAQDERQLLGRYGVWLLVGLCTPNPETTPTHTLGRLLAMLFHWFHITAYSFDDQAENTLEGLKTEFVCGWLKEICKSHFHVLVSCLLPHPPDYSRVGGHWDTMSSRTTHLKDGLNRLFCLVPYEVVSPEIWDHVMPHWMESIASDVPAKELHVLKILLSKILDPTMSPLGFDDKQIYNFIANRFIRTVPKVQEQALNWLQILTTLEIVIPLPLLFSMFSDGVTVMMPPTAIKDKDNEKSKEKEGDREKTKDSLTEKRPSAEKSDESICRSSISPVVENDSGNTSGMSDDEARTSRHIQFQTAAELNLSCCILMLDVLIKQMELQDVEPHTGLTTNTAQESCRLLKTMVGASWNGSHTCSDRTECMFCESCVMWYQLTLQLVKFLAPENPAHPPDPPLVEPNGEDSHKSPPDSDKKCEPKPDVVINMPLLEIHTVGGVLVKMPNIMTATVETVTEQLDLAFNISDERVAPAVARAVTLTDSDVASTTINVAKATLIGESEDAVDSDGEEDQENVWVTSHGKFHFSLDALPQHLQFIHQLLKEMTSTVEPDILYHMLQCLHVLVLHGDALFRAVKEYRGFVIWCQENLLIKNLWGLCNSERSHICEMSTPLLLHCITLPSGSDVFWTIIRDDFHNNDWRVRFTAVERVTVIARFMDSTPLRNNMTLQAALATAFCYLISGMDDINVHVSQRATLYLGTIHDRAMKSLIMCLETQFDVYIVDRPMVLQSLYQLHNCLSDRKILSWEFFLNRFDTLFLEAQINLEKSGDISYPRDLRNTDLSNENFIRKLNRAHEALSQSDGSGVSTKTLSASFGHKWPYKRTMSAPAAMVPRQDTKQEKEKVYSRQYSAPILKRKTSRFGLDGHIHSLNTGEDGQLVGLLHRIIDLEEADRETMHLLVFLLVQFLSRSDQAAPSEEKGTAKTQNIVLRHLYLLLGYNASERERPGFHVPPSRLRTSPVFNVFMANLPQLLDQNHLMGKHMLPTLLLLMHYCPCPQQHSHTPDTQHSPHHSLWYLEPHTRRSWLMALIVLLYKYPYTNPPDNIKLQSLVRIVLNTLDAQQHICRRIPATLMVGAPPSRSRDVSQPSLGTEGDRDRMETPPLSPMYAGVDPIGLIHSSAKTGKHQALFHQKSPGVGPGVSLETHMEEDDSAAAGSHETKRFGRRPLGSSYSTEADETESELAAIPESPKSDSTIHDTAQVSMDEVAPTEETSDSKLTEHRCSLPGDTFGTTVSQRRPIWFLGSEDNSLQKSMSIDHAGSQKWGVREGMKMMVSASLFGTPQPPTVRPVPATVTSVATPSCSGNGASTSSNNVKQRSNSLGSSSSTLITATSTSAAVTAATIATIALPRNTSTQEQPEIEKESDVWTGDQGAVSPVPRPLGRQKCIETSSTPIGAPSTPTTTSAPLQLPPVLADMTHIPWQLDYFTTKQMQQAASPQPQQMQLATPAVERLLPIGGSRPCCTTKTSSRFRSDDVGYGSPESPLSKMDVMTIGSPVEIDSENNVSEVTSLHSIEIPPTERLLPIGSNKDNVSHLVERVRQALGVSIDGSNEFNYSEQALQFPSQSFSDRRMSELDVFLPPGKHESTEKSQSSRSISPRRLIKQVALESPPPVMQPDTEESHSFYRSVHDRKPSTAVASRSDDLLRNQRQKARKSGPGTLTTGHYSMTDSPKQSEWTTPHLQTKFEPEVVQACNANFILKSSSCRVGEDCVYERCSECGAVREEYTDEELGLCIVVLGTFIHREPALAAPLLPEMLSTIAKVSLNAMYPWQYDTNIYLPGGAISVAHQFLRCVLHQLAPNGIFMQMFQTHVDDSIRLQFFRSVAQALQDFNELSPIAPLQMLLEGLNSRKTLANDVMPIVLRNMACYLDCLPMEAGLGAILAQLEVLFRRLALQLQTMDSVTPLLRIMISVLRIQGVSSYKGILDPFSKVLSYSIQNFSIKYHYLVDLCYLCHRGFIKDRDKLLLTRMVVFELVQALKFKTAMPDNNFLTLINFILQDAGGSLPLSPAMSQFLVVWPDPGPVFNTGAAECMRQHLGDALDFLADFHTLSKIKSVSKDAPVGLNEDTLGGVIKSGIAQYVALEISRGNGRDNRAVARYLPWLYNAPSSSLQQGPREFMDCIGHIRLLSWLLLGALTHTSAHCSSNAPCQPVPQDASCHISDHIQAIMSGFAEQSKASVNHMSSLFHAFILCQLWTVYLEQMASTNVPSSEAHVLTMSILLDFWGKITPCILQLVSHSRILAEMANLHFLSLMEALIESNSTVIHKLLPVWSPVLFAFHLQLPGHLQMRLQNCRNFPPSTSALPQPPTAQAGNHPVSNPVLLKWLQRLQFKMGQIEVQSSTATQFYSV